MEAGREHLREGLEQCMDDTGTYSAQPMAMVLLNSDFVE